MKNSSPLRLVQATILGVLLALLAYAIDWLPFFDSHLRLAILFEVTPFLAGCALIWRAYLALQRGMIQEKWADTQIADARRWSEATAINWLTGLLFVAGLTILFANLTFHRHGSASMLILMANPLLWARNMLRPVPPASTPQNWKKDQQRLHSSHWGEAPAPPR